jgi:hypothetical protein
VPPRDLREPRDLIIQALARVTKRRRLRDLLIAATAACSLLALTHAALVGLGVRFAAALTASALIGAAVAALIVVLRAPAWNARHAAVDVERVALDSRNVVVTAEELLRTDRWSAAVRSRVLRDAGAVAATVDARRVIPLGRSAVYCAAAVPIAIASILFVTPRTLGAIRDAADAITRSGDPADGSPAVTAIVTPPAYLQIPSRTLTNPDQITVVAGSHLELRIAGATEWRVRLGPNAMATARAADTVSAAAVLTESSYLAIEDASAPASAHRRLIPIVVTPDRAPAIRIEAPGKDLLLPDGRRDVAVGARAEDDFGLRSLELRYTRVSGSGEQFDFQEGTVPLSIDKRNAQDWTGRAALALSALKLEPGDSLVYRVVGRDGRPGDAGTASSDTFFIEIAGPGQVTVEGFDLPPDRERYALSQQMIVLKLQRLRAREQSMARGAVEEELGALAAEQRAVRANFIFLTGGHVEDEEEEAEHSNEIQEGRLENTARKEIASAIQFMSRAEQSMIAINTGNALPPARAAVEALQRAFGRNRYLLRTIPVRSRIDPSRRLSGDVDRAADAARSAPPATPDRVAIAARDLLNELLTLAPGLSSASASDQAKLTSLAEGALAASPADASWQTVSRDLLQLRDAARRRDAGPALDARLTGIVARLRAEARKGAPAGSAPEIRNPALSGAWAEEGRRR